MTWNYWLTLFLGTHCTARGLQPSTIGAYRATLDGFRLFVRLRLDDRSPDQLVARDILEYIEYLRSERNNGASACNRQVTILRGFYRAMVAMGYLESSQNPMNGFPKIKGPPVKLPVILSEEETTRLLRSPPIDTVIGLRDRALLHLLYGTGIRASECARLLDADVDFEEQTIRVTGKGNHQRVVPFNEKVGEVLKAYMSVRGVVGPEETFFRSRLRRALSRGSVYARVRYWAHRARIKHPVSPHQLRHTYASHLVRNGTHLVTIRDLLGHRMITSTQIYLHVTACDLRKAADRHPISRLAPTVEKLLPNIKIPWQHATPPSRRSG